MLEKSSIFENPLARLQQAAATSSTLRPKATALVWGCCLIFSFVSESPLFIHNLC